MHVGFHPRIGEVLWGSQAHARTLQGDGELPPLAFRGGRGLRGCPEIPFLAGMHRPTGGPNPYENGIWVKQNGWERNRGRLLATHFGTAS